MTFDFLDDENEKPVKPDLLTFKLTEKDVNELNSFITKTEKTAKVILTASFVLFSIIGIVITINNRIHLGFTVITTGIAALITWGILPMIIKFIFFEDLNSLIFEKTKDERMDLIRVNNSKYETALKDYKEKLRFYERTMSRTIWSYWLSLDPKEFEVAVGQLFIDKGYEVFITPATRDKGVDLYLKKGDKTAVVQCKNYKKALGPNAARDLYGTMTAENADEAFLVAPSGFSLATKEFCEGKPIKLLDIDELTKMSYNYENYTPRWIETAQSLEDIKKGLAKTLGKPYKRRRY